MLFIATTINYLDRQVLSLTYKDFIGPEFNWSDNDYGTVAAMFSIVYAISNLFAGRIVDCFGSKKGYTYAIFIWSCGACLHALCGTGTRFLGALGFFSMMGTTISVWLFLACRSILAIGESGNFPSAVKATAEYFPKKDRAFATSIFNAGSSVGALAAPLTIPLIAKYFGWELSFVIIGSLGFVWMGLWIWLYRKPDECKYVDRKELAYILSDSSAAACDDSAKLPKIGVIKALSYRQTWALVIERLFTDGCWWFFLFWTPVYMSDQFGYKSSDGMGMALIFTLYVIVSILSIALCRIPTYLVDKRGMNPYEGRMLAMFLFACMPLFALTAQRLGELSAWYPAVIIGIVCAGHQAWNANVYSVVGDMFPKSAIATVIGITQFAAGVGSFIINKCAGKLFTYASGTTVVDGREVEMTKELLLKGAQYARPAMELFGYTGKPAGYALIFTYCAFVYLAGWVCMKILVPKYKKIEL